MLTLAPRTLVRLLQVALGLAVCLAYAQVGSFGFVDLDDSAYVYENPSVLGGLSFEGVQWAFTATHSANWHPLTWLSHMLDVTLFGVDPTGHHWVNVGLHAANTVLVFVLLRELTAATWKSAWVAGLFGLHPLRVESVAWVSERKDVLCAFFFLATLVAWTRFVRTRRIEWRFAAVGLFVLALLAKPMAVTLPAVLLVLDVWPFARTERWKPLVVEKLPFFVLAFLSSYVTWAVQAAGGATGEIAVYRLAERAANAVSAYGVYLAQTFWPVDLCAFYPHPATLAEGVDVRAFALAAVVIVALGFVAWRERARRPWVFVGALWFLGMLVPVIGLVQVGSQAHADRYTYLPQLGVLFALVWSLGEFVERRRELVPLVGALAVCALFALGFGTWRQSAVWRSNDALYGHAIEVESRSWLAWNNLGNQHLGRGELDDAQRCFETAAKLWPRYHEAFYNLGLVRLQKLDREGAIDAFRRALELDGDNLDAWNNLGVAYLNLRRFEEARAQFEHALSLDSKHADSLHNLALTHAFLGDRASCEAAVRRLAEVDAARAAAVRSEVGLAR
ncbi:MAG: tetratricopeptide repeat protein [Planctomycetes bacterium]|nr:tetratricopeptide repeat protein [Planctomycetota bacterium]